MAILRDFLIASGVKPSDITEAVDESRAFVRGVARWARLGAQASAHVAAKAKAGTKTHRAAFYGGAALLNVAEGAEKLVGGKTK
jgi:hypothetical protein